jgi:hypothetical protein
MALLGVSKVHGNMEMGKCTVKLWNLMLEILQDMFLSSNIYLVIAQSGLNCFLNDLWIMLSCSQQTVSSETIRSFYLPLHFT